MPILRVPVAGFQVWKDGSSKGCHGNGLIPYDRPWRGGMAAGMGVVHHGRGVQRGPYSSGGPRVGPNYGNRGGSGGASRSGGPSVLSGRRGTAAVPEAVGGIPWGRWSWLRCDWSREGTGLMGCQGGSGGALRGGREPSVVSGRG